MYAVDDYEPFETVLMHYGRSKLDGAAVGSGRYPLGSGDNPNQHRGDFYSRVQELKKAGLSDKEIWTMLEMSSGEYRALYSNSRAYKKNQDYLVAVQMKQEGYSNAAIAERLGYPNESSVRSLLDQESVARRQVAETTADFLKQMVDEKGMIDVGAGVELELGISKEKLKASLEILKEQGYEVYGGSVPQITNPGQQTNQLVLCPPGTEHKDIYNLDQVHSVLDYNKILTEDGEVIRSAFEPPTSLNSDRIKVIFGDEGGSEKDGVIELRPGVNDISLGDSHYAQVRILVDGTHYLKGMAMYGDPATMPDGVDVIFNTNKQSGTPLYKVLKEAKTLPDGTVDMSNPFGALVKERGGQLYFDDPNGKYVDPVTGKRQSLAVINKTREEGDWEDWSNTLPTQFLAKQPKELIQRQIKLSEANYISEFEKINQLTNPVIKKAMLQDFADECDSQAVHLKTASLPGQKYQVILPVKSMKDNEVFAPNYENGDQVALVRFPHGGRFEIPILTVNNKQKEAVQTITKNAKDVVGINSKVAARLSGADFDGDTVMVIPLNSKIKIQSENPLKDLDGFDPKMAYPKREGMKVLSKKATQKEMGMVSNLITDMTLKGASNEEIARAVKHSMVVIDAAKHELDYKRSEADNQISELREKYQGKASGGASTLISRAKGQVSIPKRQGSPKINKETGELEYKTADNLYYTDKRGNTKMRTQKSTQMAEVKDAHELSTGTVPEELYANYANKLKALANEARKEIVNNSGTFRVSKTAKETYSSEVSSLKAKLIEAEKNSPRERAAQRAANTTVQAKMQDNPDMDKSEIKKAKQQALTKAREAVGAKRHPIEITDKEWEAIQNHAVSEDTLTRIIKYADSDSLRQRATPRQSSEVTSAEQNRIKAMARSGYTNSEIAEAVGRSVSTVVNYI